MLGNVAKVLATIATLRIGANLVSGLASGLATVRSMKVGLDGVTASTKALRLASLGLNTAVFAAVAVVGALVTAWGAAAVKAAELRQAARDLQEQLDNGVDPIEAWITVLREQGILTEDLQSLLNDSGISVEEFVRKIMSGDEAFRSMAEAAKTGQGDIETWANILGLSVEEATKLHPTFEEVKGDMNEFGDAVTDASAILDGFFQERSNEVANGLIEAGFGARFTTEEIRRMADEAVRLADARTATKDIIAGFTEGTPGRRRVEGGRGENREPRRPITFSWEEMVLAMENGEDTIEGIYDSLADASEEFSTTLGESFDEVREAITGNFPAWDEYEQASIKSLDAVIKAQDLYLEDLQAGFELQAAIAGTVSDRTLAFIEGLDPATKGALARLRETNKKGFDEWLGDVEENLAEEDALVMDYWGLKLPGHLAAGFAKLVQVAAANASALELPGEQTGDAFVDGLSSVIEGIPGEYQDDFLNYVADSMEDPEFLNSIGLNLGNDIIDGMIAAIRQMADRVGPQLDNEAGELKEKMSKSWEAASPSRWTYRLGQNITRGLWGGMDDEMDRQLTLTHNPMVNVMRPEPKLNLSTKVQSGSRDIHIYYPEHKSDDIIDGVKKASMLTSLQREAEVAIGPG